MLKVAIEWLCDGDGAGFFGCCANFVRHGIIYPQDSGSLTIPPLSSGWSEECHSELPVRAPEHFCPRCTKARQSAVKEPADVPEDQT